MPPGRFSTTIGWPRRAPNLSPSARMKTSLMPPGLVVVSARIGRVGQSCATAPKADETSAITMARQTRDERRKDDFSLKLKASFQRPGFSTTPGNEPGTLRDRRALAQERNAAVLCPARFEHDPEKACPALVPGWMPVSRLREA